MTYAPRFSHTFWRLSWRIALAVPLCAAQVGCQSVSLRQKSSMRPAAVDWRIEQPFRYLHPLSPVLIEARTLASGDAEPHKVLLRLRGVAVTGHRDVDNEAKRYLNQLLGYNTLLYCLTDTTRDASSTGMAAVVLFPQQASIGHNLDTGEEQVSVMLYGVVQSGLLVKGLAIPDGLEQLPEFRKSFRASARVARRERRGIWADRYADWRKENGWDAE